MGEPAKTLLRSGCTDDTSPRFRVLPGTIGCRLGTC